LEYITDLASPKHIAILSAEFSTEGSFSLAQWDMRKCFEKKTMNKTGL
jgi:hypothetical protein